MTFLAPLFLIAGVVAAAVVVGLHFLSTRDPETVFLPTARFAPDRPVRSRSRAVQLRELLLLALRVGLVLSVGAALARPRFEPPRRSHARILVIDRSRAVASANELRDSARALYEDGDGVVLFDSAATTILAHASDSLTNVRASSARARLSSGMIAALRLATRLRDSADSVELVLVSPLVREELDAATDSIRAEWPGAIHLARVSAARDSTPPTLVWIRGEANDPLRLAAAVVTDSNRATARIARGELTTADSSWVRSGHRVLVHWPVRLDDTASLGDRWVRRTRPDTVGAVLSDDVVVVAPFTRTLDWTGRVSSDDSSKVVARWVDGEPAAIDRRLGDGCVRAVDVPVPEEGDLVLTPRFQRLVSALAAPCGGRPGDLRPIDDASAAAIAGQREAPLLVRRAAITPIDTPETAGKWLLVLAALLMVAEFLVRAARFVRGVAT